MKNFCTAFLFTILAIIISSQVLGQAKSNFSAKDLFTVMPIFPAGNNYRTVTGEPGPDYWQNQADYKIDVKLDDKTDLISGTAEITYTNNSPHTLSFLWMQLDQNVYKKHSKGIDAKLFLDSNAEDSKFGGGFNIESIGLKDARVGNKNLIFTLHDTRMRIELPVKLGAEQKITFQIKYNYQFPRNFRNADFNVNRTDIMPSKNGDIYSVAQWYPRMCVLDDVEGWNTLPYLGNGEFYLEYGNFEVNVTVPSAYIVEASGDLMNPAEVLTPSQLQRWNKAKTSSEKVFIQTAEDVTNPASRPSKPTCTWKFKLNSARDFAWTASKSFVWEGIGIELPGGKKVMGSSLYPIESKLPKSWERSSEYVKFTLQNFSEKWFEYPYNKAVNVASNLDGMEYPGLVFCSAKDTGNMFWAVVNHELGHTWFPMVVGSNERKHAWMDEGFNAFMDNIATKDFNKHEFIGYPEIDVPVKELFADSLVPIMTRPDVIPGNEVYTVQYQKVAYLLTTLREQILGKEQFDFAFRKYIRDWAYKHPTPWDFFRSINNSTGEDLNWFWKSMFLENYKLDQKIASVTNPENDNPKKTLIVIENMEKAAMPLHVEITYKSGKKERHQFPVEIWMQGFRYSFSPDLKESVSKVFIDPDGVFPDVETGNNVWDRNR